MQRTRNQRIHRAGLVLLALALLSLTAAPLPRPVVRATPQWLLQAGATATYNDRAFTGDLQSGSRRFTVLEADGTHVTMQVERYLTNTGWETTVTWYDLPISVSTPFWLAEGAAVGDSLHNILVVNTITIANMTSSMDDIVTGQEGILVETSHPSSAPLTVLYDASCGLALRIRLESFTLHIYYLHNTTIDLGPLPFTPGSPEFLPFVTLLAAGVAVCVAAVVLWKLAGRARRRRTG